MNHTYCGIILAGGRGTRLGDCTKAVSKQLLPVYDKPMIYYPLSFLIRAGIKDILIISNPEAMHDYGNLLRGSADEWGVNFSYIEQQNPGGLAEAYLYGETFIAGRNSVMVLGDNLFYGVTFDSIARGLAPWKPQPHDGAQGSRGPEGYIGPPSPTIVGYEVADPTAYGVVTKGEWNHAATLEEKPLFPKSKLAVPGLYILDGDAPAYAKTLKPSPRGELEIVDLLKVYMEKKWLCVNEAYPTDFWFDAGTPDGLLDAANFVAATQRRTGRMIGCPYTAAKELAACTS